MVARLTDEPGYIYKFLPETSALKVLEEKRLRVSQLTELNDIFDCQPLFEPPPGETWTDEDWTDYQVKQYAKA